VHMQRGDLTVLDALDKPLALGVVRAPEVDH
jgi:hypothetical protein